MIRSIGTEIIAHLEWRYLQFRYLFTTESLTRSVYDQTATFSIESFREFLRVVDYQNEDYVIENLLSYAQNDDVFWDIGANIGTHSCYIGKKVDRVIAFEPHPETASRAAANMERNGVTGEVLEYALGEREKISSLRLPDHAENKIGVGTFTLRDPKDGNDLVEVQVKSGDELISQNETPPPDIIKIDVEGAEIGVIRGIKLGLATAHTVFVEVHPEHVKLDTVISMLEKENFNVEILRSRNDEIHVIGRKLSKDDD